MAENLQLLKRRIKTSKNIAQIAKAMEMISASKIKKAQNAVENNTPYRDRISTLTNTLLNYVNPKRFSHPYIQKNDSQKKLLIVISADKGLCGALNTNLFKKLLESEDKNTKIVAIGKKGWQYSQRLESEFITGFSIGTSLPDYTLVFQLIEIISKEYISGNVGSVEILYSQFNSIFSQEPIIKKLLPIETTPPTEEELPYLFEPEAEKIIDDLLPYYIEVMLYSAIIESFTSEQAARMVAMQNAKNNALDIADYLTLSYNKARQERITNELLALSYGN